MFNLFFLRYIYISQRMQWHPTPVLTCLENLMSREELEGYSLWGHKWGHD